MIGAGLPRGRWQDWKDVKQLQATLEKHNVSYAFTGGALRDIFYNRTPYDIDLVVAISQTQLVELLKKESYMAHALHGRTSAVRIRQTKRPFDIVSMAAYGMSDAPFADQVENYLRQNGDLRLNSTALLADGTWMNPCEGLEDLQAKRVRILPRAAEIMKDNAARIIRFFRMHAIYARGPVDPYSVEVCQAHAQYLRTVETSQYSTNFFKWLAVPKLAESIALIRKYGIFEHMFPIPLVEQQGLRRLEKIEKLTGSLPDVEIRLPFLLRQAEISPYMALEIFLKSWNIDDSVGDKFKLLLDMQLRVPRLTLEAVSYIARTHGNLTARQLVMLNWANEPYPEKARVKYQPFLDALEE